MVATVRYSGMPWMGVVNGLQVIAEGSWSCRAQPNGFRKLDSKMMIVL